MATMRLLVVLLAGLLGCQAQERCCFPSQWESSVGLLEGYRVKETDTPGEVEGYDFVSYDYDNKILLSNLSLITETGTHLKIVVLADYNKGKVFQTVDGNCTSMNLAGVMPPNCIPANATYAGSTYFGAGNNRLYFDSWQMNYMGVPIFMTVTKTDCIPVSESLTSLGPIVPGVDGFAVLSYAGLTVGIKDQKVFEPPTNCRHLNITGPGIGVIGRKRSIILSAGH